MLSKITMKSFYSIIVVCGFLIVLSSCFIPSSRGIPIGTMLLSHPQEWQFKFVSPDHKLAGIGEDAGKALLLCHLRRSQNDFSTSANWGTTALSLVLFGTLGWCRERSFEKERS